MPNHGYTPSTVPSVDGQGCLWRNYNRVTREYERVTCQVPQHLHPTTCPSRSLDCSCGVHETWRRAAASL